MGEASARYGRSEPLGGIAYVDSTMVRLSGRSGCCTERVAPQGGCCTERVAPSNRNFGCAMKKLRGGEYATCTTRAKGAVPSWSHLQRKRLYRLGPANTVSAFAGARPSRSAPRHCTLVTFSSL